MRLFREGKTVNWVQCPRCGSCRDRYEEGCGCIVTECDSCLLVEINPESCTQDEDGNEMEVAP